MFQFFIALLALLTPPEPYSPPKTIPNILTYGGGSVEVDAEINPYQKLIEDAPIQGSIFITQEQPGHIEASSFQLGDTPLQTTFVSSNILSEETQIRISIYSFTLQGLPAGVNNLPPISVIVGDRRYQASPLSIEVSAKQ